MMASDPRGMTRKMKSGVKSRRRRSPMIEMNKFTSDFFYFIEIKEYSHWSLAEDKGSVVDYASVSGAQGDGEEEVESFGDMVSISYCNLDEEGGVEEGKKKSMDQESVSVSSEKGDLLVSPTRSGKTRNFSLGNLNGFSMVDEVSKFIDLGKPLGFSMDGTEIDFQDMINGWRILNIAYIFFKETNEDAPLKVDEKSNGKKKRKKKRYHGEKYKRYDKEGEEWGEE
ncbi:hypothetical protein L1987_75899 [Smallanthus sonchifolius]|uniref:Uncharacterized protein n=1 Tax=Smallanthus sonchifolius TaxID=185202 RepID=A0ACB9A7S3_9ASTR|nr:hypothetical protein L1987_75899 [Smallanthus sonchifolius]